MNNLVSVIMPVYNAEAFVAEAIDSVLAQTYPRWELIVIDDGSTDASPEVLNRYTDPRIVTIRQQNKGEGGARNTGLDRARGEYIGFLDADDVFLPTALTNLVGYLRQHDEVDVAIADGYYCDEVLRPLRRLSECRPRIYEGMILEPLLLSPLVVSVPVCMMARKSSIDASQVRFDETLRYGVDWDFWIQLARQARYGSLPELTGLYRLHPKSMTRSATQSALYEKLVPGRLKAMNAAWFDEPLGSNPPAVLLWPTHRFLGGPARRATGHYGRGTVLGTAGWGPGRITASSGKPPFAQSPKHWVRAGLPEAITQPASG